MNSFNGFKYACDTTMKSYISFLFLLSEKVFLYIFKNTINNLYRNDTPLDYMLYADFTILLEKRKRFFFIHWGMK